MVTAGLYTEAWPCYLAIMCCRHQLLWYNTDSQSHNM